MNDNLLYWVWLAERCGADSKDFGRLIVRYPDPFEVYRMSDEALEHVENIGEPLRHRLGDKDLDSARETLKYCEKYHVRILTYGDEAYPASLRGIAAPPVLLYVLGRLPDLNNRCCVGVVGTRRISEYGIKMTYKISYGLAEAGAVVVSGLAKGVDGVAACAALAAGGDTVAVLGCGISTAYPRQHRSLMKAIARGGVIVTEYSPHEPPQRWNFPKRNRIISALSQGVLMAEGAVKSGAMITMEYAEEQGKDLLAIPGEVGEGNAAGPNHLLQKGAMMVTCAEDILKKYRPLYTTSLKKEKDCVHLAKVPAETAFRTYGVSMMYGGAATEIPTQTLPSPDATKAQGKPKKKEAKRQEKEEAKPSRMAVEQELLFPDDVSRRVYHALPEEVLFVADSVTCDGLSTAEILTSLTMLELYGLVSAHPGGHYRKETP